MVMAGSLLVWVKVVLAFCVELHLIDRVNVLQYELGELDADVSVGISSLWGCSRLDSLRSDVTVRLLVGCRLAEPAVLIDLLSLLVVPCVIAGLAAWRVL